MAVATTTALLIGAGIAAAGATASTIQGAQAAASANDQRRKAKLAQDEALRVQMIERQRSVQAEMKADRASPASTVVMPDMLAAGTDKTGGIDDRLRLQRGTKLGGG